VAVVAGVTEEMKNLRAGEGRRVTKDHKLRVG
jgi:hypothetical protein